MGVVAFSDPLARCPVVPDVNHQREMQMRSLANNRESTVRCRWFSLFLQQKAGENTSGSGFLVSKWMQVFRVIMLFQLRLKSIRDNCECLLPRQWLQWDYETTSRLALALFSDVLVISLLTHGSRVNRCHTLAILATQRLSYCVKLKCEEWRAYREAYGIFLLPWQMLDRAIERNFRLLGLRLEREIRTPSVHCCQFSCRELGSVPKLRTL